MALLQRLIAFNDQLIYRGRAWRVVNGWDWTSRRCLEGRCGRCQKIWSACSCLWRGGTNWERWSSTSSITLPDGQSTIAQVGVSTSASKFAPSSARAISPLIGLRLGGGDSLALDTSLAAMLRADPDYRVIK
jgi:hypothetical protein